MNTCDNEFYILEPMPYICHNGTAIEPWRECDGTPDCLAEGEDEQSCASGGGTGSGGKCNLIKKHKDAVTI